MSDPRQKDFDERHTRIPVVSLTKREYFAAMALSGLCVPGALQLPTDYPYVADKCVRIADELIKQLADGRPR